MFGYNRNRKRISGRTSTSPFPKQQKTQTNTRFASGSRPRSATLNDGGRGPYDGVFLRSSDGKLSKDVLFQKSPTIESSVDDSLHPDNHEKNPDIPLAMRLTQSDNPPTMKNKSLTQKLESLNFLIQNQNNYHLVPFLSPIELDVKWLFDLLFILESFYNDLNKPKPHPDDSIGIQIYQDLEKLTLCNVKQVLEEQKVAPAHFSWISFDIAVNVLTHVCARERILQLDKGMYVLYRYLFHMGKEKAVIFRARAYGYKTQTIKSLPESVRAFYQGYYPTSHHIIHIPWQQALVLHKRRRLHMENGIIYATWQWAAEWMQSCWQQKVRQWKQFDHETFLFPLWNEYMQHFGYLAPRLGTKRFTEFESTVILPPINKILKEDQIFSIEHPNLQRFAYHPISAHFQHLKKNLPSNSSSSSSSSSSPTFQAYVPKNATGSFMKDYWHLLPPCIANLIQKQFEEKTHLKFQERKLVFDYLVRIKIPESLATELWTAMCSTHQAPQDVKDVPQQMYKWSMERNLQDSLFYGCQTLKQKFPSLCPFEDIEDIALRQSQCIDHIWFKRFQNPVDSYKPKPLTTKKWSPKVAFVILSSLENKK